MTTLVQKAAALAALPLLIWLGRRIVLSRRAAAAAAAQASASPLLPWRRTATGG